MMRRIPSKGFTIIELILTMGILVAAGTIFLALLTWGFRLSRENQRATTLQVESIEALDQMSRDIRGASDVITATDATLTIDVYPRYPSAYPDRISYTVVGTRLERAVTPYPYSPADETVRGLTNNMASNSNLFRYFNEAGNELSAPIPTGLILLIEVNLTVQDTSLRKPQVLTNSTRVHLRNRKTNL